MRKLFILIIPAIALAGTVLAQSLQPLFLIERTKNANKLYYEAVVGKDGAISAKEPVKAHWIMWAKDSTGKTTEPLSFLEKKVAYGYDISPDPSGARFNMSLKPFRERIIRVYMKDGKARAEILIDGRPSYFAKMYIYSKGDSKPDSIKLYGTDVESGGDTYEKVVPAK